MGFWDGYGGGASPTPAPAPAKSFWSGYKVSPVHQAHQKTMDIAAGAVTSAKLAERSLLKPAIQNNPDLGALNAMVKKNTVKPGLNVGNLFKAARDVGVGIARFTPRATAELATTGYNLVAPHAGLPKQSFKPASLGRPGTLLYGKEPAQATTEQGINAAVTHPKGFHIKGTPITLSPTQTGITETVGKTLMDALAIKGSVNSVAKFSAKQTAKNTAAKNTVKNSAVQNILNKAKETPQKPSSAPAITTPKLIDTPVKTQIKPAGQGTLAKPKIARDESGHVEVPDAKALIQKHQQSVKFSGDVRRFADSSEGAKGNLLNDAAKLTKNRLQLSNEEKTQLQAYRDAKMTKQAPPQISDRVKAADSETTAFAKAKITNDVERAKLEGNLQKAQELAKRDPESYTHRAAQGKGSAFDYVLQNDRKNPLSVGLGKTTPADKARTYHAITDEEGNRQVVSIKSKVFKDERGQKVGQGKVVNAISGGGLKSERLGVLKLKSGQDFLDKQVEPYKRRLDQLQQQYKALNKVRVKEGIPRGQIDSLAKKVEDLRNLNLFTDLPTGTAKAFDRAHVQLKALNNLKYFKEQSNVPTHINKILNRIDELKKQVDNAAAEYSPEELKDKKFVRVVRDENGKKIGTKTYTIDQASADEITKATGQKYYTDPWLTNHAAYLDSRVALENARMFDAIKKAPESATFMAEPGETAPKGWKQVPGLMQFQGYRFEPRVAQSLEDAFSRDSPDALDKIGSVLKQSIVYFPVKHDFNMAAAYVIDRGASGFINPLAMKNMLVSWKRAFSDIKNKTPFYQKVAEKGFSLTTNDRAAFDRVFKTELQKLTPETIHPLAATAKLNPIRLYNAIQRLTVWDVQDFLNLARIHERMESGLVRKGMKFEDALKETEKFNFQYKAPERVAGSRTLSRTLQSPKIFFGRYRYDQYKIVGNILKGIADLRSPSKALQNVDRLAALAAVSFLIWPEVNKGIQKLTGNPNAYIKGPGPAELLETANKVREGKETIGRAGSNQLYLGPLQQLLDFKNNVDSFTGKNIYDPNSSAAQQGKDIWKWLASRIAPVQRSQGLKNASGNRLINIGLMLSGANFPKNSPEAGRLSSLKFDTLPRVQANAKNLAANGNTAAAIELIRQYDQNILDSAKKALKTSGLPITDDKTLIGKLKKSGFYYDPTQDTVNSWKNPAAKSGALDQILNAQPTPKKGDPGYFDYLLQRRQKAYQNKFKAKNNSPVIP